MQPSPPAEPVPGGSVQPVALYPYAHRTTTPTTLGTLSIVFGALAICSSVLSVAFASGVVSVMHLLPGRTEAGGAAVESYQHAAWLPLLIRAVVFIAMSVWLIRIGIDQGNYRARAVRQSRRWAILALVIVVVDLVMTIVVTMPVVQHMMDATNAALGTRDPYGGEGGIIGVIFQVAVHAPYPIILLVAFRKPSIVNAMAS